VTVQLFVSAAISSGPIDPKVGQCLSEMEKHVCSLFMRIEIPGKRYRRVSLLCTDDKKLALDISENNEYIFALGKGSLSYIQGHDVLR